MRRLKEFGLTVRFTVQALGVSLSEIPKAIDVARLRNATSIAAVLVGGELVLFWWAHASVFDRITQPLWALGCVAGAYFGQSLSHLRHARSHSDLGHARSHSNRRIHPARALRSHVKIADDVYSALRNLGYDDREIRRVFNLVPDDSLGDFDTLFRCAMAHLSPPGPQV